MTIFMTEGIAISGEHGRPRIEPEMRNPKWTAFAVAGELPELQ